MCYSTYYIVAYWLDCKQTTLSVFRIYSLKKIWLPTAQHSRPYQCKLDNLIGGQLCVLNRCKHAIQWHMNKQLWWSNLFLFSTHVAVQLHVCNIPLFHFHRSSYIHWNLIWTIYGIMNWYKGDISILLHILGNINIVHANCLAYITFPCMKSAHDGLWMRSQRGKTFVLKGPFY